MSGLRPIEQEQFYRRLRERGVSVDILADCLHVSRPTLTRVLNGSRRRGHLWAKLVKFLTPEEVALLDVAHCSPWNKKRVEKRPRWNPEKLPPRGELLSA